MARKIDDMSFIDLRKLSTAPLSQVGEKFDNMLTALRDSGSIAVWDGPAAVGVLVTPDEYKTLAGAVVAPQERLQWQALAEANLAGVGAHVAVATIKDLARRLLELTSG